MKYTELNDCEEFYHKVEYYNKTKTEQLSYHYKEILKLLGEDPDREGLVKTPYRVAKAMQFMTRGYHENPEEILRSALFKEDYRQMVIVKNIEIYSMCEHHMLPFIGQAHVAYIPNGYITGLSKIARVIEFCFSTPRICIHMCLASTTTITPNGFKVSCMHSLICSVMRSCTCRR